MQQTISLACDGALPRSISPNGSLPVAFAQMKQKIPLGMPFVAAKWGFLLHLRTDRTDTLSSRLLLPVVFR